jgi:hypothetical protein
MQTKPQDQATQDQLKVKQDAANAAEAKVADAEDKAWATWKKGIERGTIPAHLTFAQWASTGALSYINAKNTNDAAQAIYMDALNIASGPMAGNWLRAVNNLKAAKNNQIFNVGLNMPVMTVTAPAAREMYQLYTQGRPAPAIDVTKQTFQPYYSCTDYVEAVRRWQMPSPAKPGTTYNVTMKETSEVDETKFGQKKTEGEAGISYGPWIAFGVSGSKETQEETLDSKIGVGDVTLSFSFEDSTKATIVPGQW